MEAKTAVIVDDEPIIRMDLEGMLTDMGFQVVAQGADGFDAIECCRKYRPDLLFLDIKMPVFDGLSAAKTISEEKNAGCIILLTAFYDEEFIERAKEIGVSGYLVKPVSERSLRPAIAIAVEQSERYGRAVQELEKAERKLREAKVIEKAKAMIASRDRISESEAYAQMRALSMRKQCSIGAIAQRIVAADTDQKAVQSAKEVLMKRRRMSESAAYQEIKKQSEIRGVSQAMIAREILKQNGRTEK